MNSSNLNKAQDGSSKNSYLIGLLCSISCAVLWGVLPVYWKSLNPIDSFVIIFYRVLLVAITTLVIACFKFGFKGAFKPIVQNKKVALRCFIAGAIITVNWSTFIWAVSAGHVVQTSIGYYMQPLIVTAFGLILFKEKINNFKKIALCIAVVGVIFMLISYSEPPIIAFTLAITFAIYSATKKKYKLDPILSLLYETVFLAPVALLVIIWFETNGNGAFAVAEPYQIGLLMLCGIFTAAPLILFGFGANKINLVTLGITGYISPSLMLTLGVFLYGEPFDMIQFVSFSILWIGLVFFTLGEIKANKKSKEVV